MNRQAVFLDRDGTIAEHVHYMRRPEEFRLLPGAGEAIARLNAAGNQIVVVTNQSGIARGYLTEAALGRIHLAMRRELARFGAWVDAVYHCAHHPDDGCACRKPRPGMLLRAAEELSLPLGRCVMVGDQPLDVLAGKAAGIRTVLVRTGAQPAAGETAAPAVQPDFEAGTLMEAVDWILARQRPRARRVRLSVSS